MQVVNRLSSKSGSLRGRKGQSGFTLIELLVVVTILGILAAIVTLSLVGLTTNANVQSCNTEYKTVQSALDAYMANNQLSVLPVNQPITDANGAQASWTNDMTGDATIPGSSPPAKPAHPDNVPLYNSNPSGGSPNYTRNGTTQFYYKWDQFGKITGIGSDSGGSPINGCVPK